MAANFPGATNAIPGCYGPITIPKEIKMEVKIGDAFVRDGKRLRIKINDVRLDNCDFEVIYCGPGVHFMADAGTSYKSVGYCANMSLIRLARLYSRECRTILSIRNKNK